MIDKKLLESVRVVDFSTYIDSLTCGSMLAELGVKGIKKEVPSSDADRFLLVLWIILVRSILVECF